MNAPNDYDLVPLIAVQAKFEKGLCRRAKDRYREVELLTKTE